MTPPKRPHPFYVSRRRFLKATAILAASGLPDWFVEESRGASKPRLLSANDKPGVALIGCGNRGSAIGRLAAQSGEVLAVCDVDEKYTRAALRYFPRATRYKDFRKVLEREDIHAVLNATPDHWHTLINLAALKAGKDVYAEKPLTLTIDEGRQVVAAVRRTRRMLQTGSQQRNDPRFLLACELVRNGRVGKLQRIIAAVGRGKREGPFATAPVPPGLDWDFWQGQAPDVPYVPQRCHGSFRHWWEYAGGRMTDWGAHHNDIAQWANGTDRSGPVEIAGRALIDTIPGGYTVPARFSVEYHYANGVVLNTTSEAEYNGVRFEGDQGWIFVSRHEINASEEELFTKPLPSGARRLRRKPAAVAASTGVDPHMADAHMAEFFDCVRTRRSPGCDAEIGHRSATVCHLGNIAIRLGRRLKWDPAREKFVGDPEANTWLAREQRRPWTYDLA
jgi:predicted dehydrogenase